MEDKAIISHLLGYGIIEISGGKIPGFKNEMLFKYICDQNKYKRTLKSDEERIKEVQERLYNAEIKLQRAIRQTLQICHGEPQARNIVMQAFAGNNTKNSSYNQLSYNELFSDKTIKQLRDYSRIIQDNWTCFDKYIPDKNNFDSIMKSIIGIRNKAAYHPSEMSPISETEFGQFRSDMEQFEQWFKPF
jgi:hypothetical protein